MPAFARPYFFHHWRFYACALLGGLVYALSGALKEPVRGLASGDAFFLAYVILMAVIAARITPRELDRKADVEDEGIVLVVVIAVAMIAFSSFAIFTVLHQKGAPDPFALALAAAGAPLGWCMLHM